MIRIGLSHWLARERLRGSLRRAGHLRVALYPIHLIHSTARSLPFMLQKEKPEVVDLTSPSPSPAPKVGGSDHQQEGWQRVCAWEITMLTFLVCSRTPTRRARQTPAWVSVAIRSTGCPQLVLALESRTNVLLCAMQLQLQTWCPQRRRWTRREMRWAGKGTRSAAHPTRGTPALTAALLCHLQFHRTRVVSAAKRNLNNDMEKAYGAGQEAGPSTQVCYLHTIGLVEQQSHNGAA